MFSNTITSNGVLYNGDCLEVMSRLMLQGVKVDCVITDPPYKLDFHGGGQQKRAKEFDTLKSEIDFMTSGFNEEALDFMTGLCRIPNILIFCSNKQISWLMSYFEAKGLSTTLLVWKKPNACPLGKGKHISDLEFVIFARGKGAHFNNDAGYKLKYKLKEFPSINGKKRFHKAEKPLELIKEYVLLHSFEGDTILDPYMGSGTTCLACKELGRKFVGIEIREDFYEISKERLTL